MTEAAAAISDDSWSFALKLYAEPGIAEACLELQADAGVDVMLLLTVAFAASQRRILLTPTDIRDLDNACRPWREQVVQPLRAIRTALKSGPIPAPSQATEKLRSQIKASELAAERLENDLLAAWLLTRAPGERKLTSNDVTTAVLDVVRHALGEHRQDRIHRMTAAIAALVAAADKPGP